MVFVGTSCGQDLPTTAQEFADQLAEAVAKDQSEQSENVGLKFSFAATPWRDVITWLAEEGDLALHVGDLPPGSFTYSDPGTFTHQDAVDRVNLFLLPQGFTLVRSGNLLTVINLSDPRSLQQLDAMANLVSLEELGQRKGHDVVKCIFPLGEIKAEEAVQELEALQLMSTPTILSKTNQLIITDTAAKLRNVQQVLNAFESDEMSNGTVVKSFTLQHVSAEDVLLVARPHMGLATGEMIGIDVSLSADLQGKHIFITGVEDKVKLLEGLVSAIDVPQKGAAGSGMEVLQAHLVSGGNVETVYTVLQTLLAGETIRLSMDETAGTIVALATPEIHKEIADTVAQLQASEADFEVIQLKTVDPYFVISLLEEMLDLPSELDDPDDIDPDAPRVDADPGNMRLFVRAKRAQIDQIKKIVEGLDGASDQIKSEEIRVFPLKGEAAKRVLITASKFWRGANAVILYQSEQDEPAAKERVINQEPDSAAMTATQFASLDLREERVLTSNANPNADEIRCQITPRGLLLQSQDTEALDLFEEHLRTISGPADSIPSPPVVFYLKYVNPNDAVRLLAELIDGGEAAKEGEAGTLINGYVSSSSADFLLGTLVTSRDGMMTLTSGPVTIVADMRLNRLITQGSASDIERIEEYLKIIDKDNSITDVETHGTSRVIELVNTKADEVASVLREAFAGRVQASTSKQQSSPEQEAAAAKAAAAEAKKDAAKRGSAAKKPSQPERDLEPKMTIAVHPPSNSLIVTAPEQLFREVEKLAVSIDQRNEQTVEVVAPLNGLLYESVLQQVLLGQEPTTRRPTSSNRSPTSNRDTPKPKDR